MTDGSRFLLYLLLAGIGLVAALVLFSLGPLGWALLAALLIALMAYGARSDDGGPDRINCGSCGSPNPIDRETCTHCGDPL